MPGVPPNAFADMKRGLKGMFSRKKKEQHHHTQATSEANAGTGTAAAASASHGHHVPATAPAATIPQISEPANVGASQNIDLNPSTPAGTAAATAAPSTKEPAAAKLDIKHHAEGMSATSGPLNDDLSGVYEGAATSPVEAEKTKISAPAAKIDKMERFEQASGSIGGVPVTGAAATRATAATEDKKAETGPAAEPVT